MSYNIKPRPGKILENPLSIKSKSLPLHGSAASRAHTYTFFASGGEATDTKAEKEQKSHADCLEEIQEEDKERWRQLERAAGLSILFAYRASKQRKKMSKPTCSITTGP